MKIAYALYPDLTGPDLVGPHEVISRRPDSEVHFVPRTLEPVRADRGDTVAKALPTGAGTDVGAAATRLVL